MRHAFHSRETQGLTAHSNAKLPKMEAAGNKDIRVASKETTVVMTLLPAAIGPHEPPHR